MGHIFTVLSTYYQTEKQNYLTSSLIFSKNDQTVESKTNLTNRELKYIMINEEIIKKIKVS